MLNFKYAILEAETSIALQAIGLDPGMGMLHADVPGRDSLALDVMEPVRADVDGWLLGELERRTFEARDFFDTREGFCRLMPKLAKSLAETAPRWAALVTPVSEGVARTLAVASTTKADGTPAPGRFPSAQRPANMAPQNGDAVGCLGCGVVMEAGTRRRFCYACRPRRRAAVGSKDGQESLEIRRAIFSYAGGPAALAKMREEGRDPAHGGEAAERRGRTITAQMEAIADWEGRHERGGEDTDFTRDILPGLQPVPLRIIAEATGLTPGYCSFVRRGLKVPHRRHWMTLARLARDHSADRSKPAMG